MEHDVKYSIIRYDSKSNDIRAEFIVGARVCSFEQFVDIYIVTDDFT
jgi:hypothetical protein